MGFALLGSIPTDSFYLSFCKGFSHFKYLASIGYIYITYTCSNRV